jgi:zinc finger MYND domain-containing protein 10
MLPGGITHGEVEQKISKLKIFSPDQIGKPEWKSQRQSIELFNIISHQAAQKKSDDFVLSQLVSYEKMPVLVHELCIAEAMRNKVYSKTLKELSEAPAGIYLYVQYESVILNFLQVVLYHEEAVTALGDHVLDLIDYCWRTITFEFLSGGGSIASDKYSPNMLEGAGGDPKAIASLSPEERLNIQLRELQIRKGFMCISILWFIVERIPALPLAAVNSILNKHDLVVGFANLIEIQPWTYRSKKSGNNNDIYKFKNNAFEKVSAADVPLVVIPEAHTWFALHYLVCDRDCRTKYQYNRFRKEQVMRVKKYLNEVLVDQLPVLTDLQRLVEELSFIEPPAGTEEKFKTKMLLIDHVSPLQSAIQNFAGWDDIIHAFKTTLTKDPEVMRADAKIVSEIIDWMGLEDDGS